MSTMSLKFYLKAFKDFLQLKILPDSSVNWLLFLCGVVALNAVLQVTSLLFLMHEFIS